ncbi:NifB/NifX family molybdenum-iron cluster-binding protein [Edwardsiella piscicida]|uniref:Dinitrogenase iron-molybdenum cofactor biosynthesis domain-containing protein n=3 Tax=Edwardsiella TaxID=635 RepID=A0A0H3DUH8_EDWTF|nr:NifB/NifX family molybdenum-iron cluster-binding protein [Edwardsiella piscicida]ACY84483.1 hypothetical protein ETAE_1642 [Edwardsiella tarda EIB202]ADM41594.1 hypothetical protein ETAF_1484 [Edwardsiella tarda FL6-60]AGH73622.1 hypothetical protein ETAC_07505 [Edwardsiella piscicida C07-087]ARD16852.1 hypothetical protein BXA22_00010 [Edwardsiella piscicida]ARD20004.1 hypothetical protein BXA22_17340 [Edwardsiella piscicida]
MLTAIPMHGNRIAGHLARAPQVAIFDQRGCEIARYDNPAAAEHCAGKKQLLALLRQHQVQRLVVRNVGQHMAQRLLAMGLEIRLTKGGDLQSAYCQDRCPLPALTDPAQARPPRKAHDGAHGCGGGCHHGAEPATPSLLQPRHSQNGAPHIVRCQRI